MRVKGKDRNENNATKKRILILMTSIVRERHARMRKNLVYKRKERKGC